MVRIQLHLGLAQKMLLPLLVAWLLLQGIIVVWMLDDFKKTLNESMEKRGRLLASTINYSADNARTIQELRHLVSTLASDRETQFIAVVSGNPWRIIASTDQSLNDKQVSQVLDAEKQQDLFFVFKNKQDKIYHHNDKNFSEFLFPFTLAQADFSENAIRKGVLIIRLDSSAIKMELRSRLMQMIVVMTVVTALGAFFVWGLLKIYVLRSSESMIAAIEKRSQGSRTARAVVHGDDEMAWLAETLNAMFDELDGEEAERIRAEGKLRRANFFQQALLNSAGVTIIATDVDGIIKIFNPNAEKLLGYSAEELINFATPGLFHDPAEVIERARLLSNELGRVVEPGFEVFVLLARERAKPDTNEWTYIHKNGNRIPVRLTVTCLRDDAGELNGYIGIAHDITEQKRTDTELRELTDAAQKATKAKSEFLATMSHEIRTPMNGVIGMTNLLQKTPLSQRQKELVESIHFSGEVLMAIINDVLDFSKIDADKMVLEEVPFSVSRLFDQAHQVYLPAAEKKEVRLVLNKTDADCVLVGDPIRLTQVVNNLVSNAIKFTEQGNVTVSVAIETIDENNKILQFSVKDTGVGMTKAQQDKLFQPFTQADSSTTRQYGGTGLGLVICKKLILLMGGNIALRSKRNLGTEFVVRVPLSCAHGKIAEELLSNTAIFNLESNIQLLRDNPITILLVDDVLINQEVACGILEEAGCKVRVADNGFKAIEIYQNHHSEIDVVLMDCLMPEMDGYQTAQKIRVFEQETHKHTPIIALTASALAETREKCLAAGMDDFVSKPFNEMELLNKIRQLVAIDSPALNRSGADTQCVLAPIAASNPVLADNVDHEVLEQLFSRFGKEKGKMLLDKFIASMDEFVINLDKAFSDGDNTTMHRMVHNLKSSCGNVGAVQAKAHAEELEKNIDQCEGVFSNRESLNLLIDLVSQAKKQIVDHRSFS